MSNTPSANVTGVRVEQLFGLYDYALGDYAENRAFGPSLVVLYGDNGSGKTTLLRLINHTLSKELKGGHRTALAKFPLKRFQVRVADGSEVGLVREGDSIQGGYTFFVRRPGGIEHSTVALVDQTGGVNPAPDPDAQVRWSATMDALKSLNLALYYLPDDRRPETTKPEPTTIEFDEELYQYVLASTERGVTTARVRQKSNVLEEAIRDLQNIIRDEVLKAAGVGEANIYTIYAEIAKRALASGGKPLAVTTAESRELVQSLTSLMERSRQFSRLGLVPRLDLQELITLSTQAKATTRRFLASVLKPYQESVSARLQALSPTRNLLDTFLGSLNSFYARKQVTFDVGEGLRIVQDDGSRLPPSALSSGEQQLLLLFCNTVRARVQATVFLIDEPELSLNVKWQRRLIDALLRLVAGSPVQFFLATHSIELLARHKEAVVHLEPPVRLSPR